MGKFVTTFGEGILESIAIDDSGHIFITMNWSKLIKI